MTKILRRDYFVYFALDPTLGAIKIGISPFPEKRLKALNHERYPYLHYLLGRCQNRMTDDGVTLETKIHKDLRSKLVPGPSGAREWFWWNSETKEYFETLMKKENGDLYSHQED